MTGRDSTGESRRRHAATRARKCAAALIRIHSCAVRRTGDTACAYPVRSWWWDKAATDAVLAEAEACLALVEDAATADTLRWHRHAVYWQLGRFAEAEADLVHLNRPDSAYVRQIGQSLGLIRRGKFMHEAI